MRGHRPGALIVTLYSLYTRDIGSWLSVAAIVQLMSEFGVDAQAVRSAISRLKRCEVPVLNAERVGGAAGYTMSDDSRVRLDEGNRRIFERRRAAAGEGWILAVFSVPEAEREKRAQLRNRLTWLGFGTVTAGVWIAPSHIKYETHDLLTRTGLDTYVDLFEGSYWDFATLAERVPEWWDLDRLQDQYATFVDDFGPVLAGYEQRATISEQEAFTCYTAAMSYWRRLPYIEPGLPLELLPRGWNGILAADMFAELRERLAAPAHAFFASTRAGQLADGSRRRGA